MNKKFTCFEVRVKCIDFVFNLEIQFQALHCFYFFVNRSYAQKRLSIPKTASSLDPPYSLNDLVMLILS